MPIWLLLFIDIVKGIPVAIKDNEIMHTLQKSYLAFLLAAQISGSIFHVQSSLSSAIMVLRMLNYILQMQMQIKQQYSFGVNLGQYTEPYIWHKGWVERTTQQKMAPARGTHATSNEQFY